MVFLAGCLIHQVFISKLTTPKNLEFKIEDSQQLNSSLKNVINTSGRLQDVGTSLNHTKTINIKGARGPLLGITLLAPLRWKKWDSYTVFHQQFVLQISVIDAGLYQAISYKQFDLSQRTITGSATDKAFTLFGVPPAYIPNSHSLGQDYQSYYKSDLIDFQIQDSTNGIRKLTFSNKDTGLVTLNIDNPEQNTQNVLVDIIPLDEDKNAWAYLEKRIDIPATANFNKNGQKLSYNAEELQLIIGANRGFFNYHNDVINVLGALKTQNGKRLSWSLSSGLSNSKSRKSTPDFFFVDGVGTQLLPVQFKVDVLNLNNSMEFFTFDENLREKKAPGSMSLVFGGLGNHLNSENYIVSATYQHHAFGYFEGWIVDSEGVEHTISGASGMIELFYAKW